MCVADAILFLSSMTLPPSTHFVFLFENPFILRATSVYFMCCKNLTWKTKLEIASKRMNRGINTQLHDVVRQMHTHTHTHTHKQERETIRTWWDSELFIKVSAFVKPSSFSERAEWNSSRHQPFVVFLSDKPAESQPEFLPSLWRLCAETATPDKLEPVREHKTEQALTHKLFPNDLKRTKSQHTRQLKRNILTEAESDGQQHPHRAWLGPHHSPHLWTRGSAVVWSSHWL